MWVVICIHCYRFLATRPSAAAAPAPAKNVARAPTSAPKATTAPKAPAAPVIVYAPQRSFNAWASGLADEPTMCFSFVIGIFSGDYLGWPPSVPLILESPNGWTLHEWMGAHYSHKRPILWDSFFNGFEDHVGCISSRGTLCSSFFLS